MIKLQSPVDVAVEMLRDLEEFNRSGSKDTFRKQLREKFVRRSGAASLDVALTTAMTSLLCLTPDERVIAGKTFRENMHELPGGLDKSSRYRTSPQLAKIAILFCGFKLLVNEQSSLNSLKRRHQMSRQTKNLRIWWAMSNLLELDFW